MYYSDVIKHKSRFKKHIYIDLYISGNKNLLRCEEKVWKHLIRYYETEKCLVDARYFPPPKKRKRRLTGRALDEGDLWIEV